jgi:glutamine phosphoribosylpyrophosphate amidotransferase
MTDATGRWVITFNGEIYNYRELRLELERRGRTLITNSDTEILINVVAEWGEGDYLLERLAPWITSSNPLTKRDLAASAKLSVDMLLNRPKTGFITPVRLWPTARSISRGDYVVGRVKYTDIFACLTLITTSC